MRVLSLFSGQGGPVGWGMHHRHHHWYSDTDKDPHMRKEHPVLMWFFPDNLRGDWLEPDGSWDLLDDKYLMFMQKWYWYFHFLLLIAVSLIDFKIALYLIFIPNMIAIHQQGSINVLGHGYGYRNFDTPDESTNSKLLALVTYGDNLQNNHHALPWSYDCAIKPGEYDFSAWIIRNFLAKTVVGPDANKPLV
jgi:stearoyl-CoA desaturase (delta-9 desaturase)